MNKTNINNKYPDWTIRIARWFNIIVLICSLVIFLVLSIEVLEGSSYIPNNWYLRIQLIICIIFLLDFIYLFIISNNRKKYLLRNFLFLIVSIPYINITHWVNIPVDPFYQILLKAIVLIRGGYGLVIMITWFNQSKISNLLYSYIAILLGCTYFGSLAFYTLEKATNPGIKDFSDSIWWACMDVTTVGCSIEPTTPEGRILAVVLAILGMSMFPILTAYITNKFQKSINNHDHK